MAVKVIDGLFIGDRDSSLDIFFLASNKISNLVQIITTVGGSHCDDECADSANYYISSGLLYHTINWKGSEEGFLFYPSADHDNESFLSLSAMVQFIDRSLSRGTSVLIFNLLERTELNNIAICVYLMMKYQWKHQKAIDFVSLKRQNFQFSQLIYSQLLSLGRVIASRQSEIVLSFASTSPEKQQQQLQLQQLQQLQHHQNPVQFNWLAADEIILDNSYINSSSNSNDLDASMSSTSTSTLSRKPKVTFNSSKEPQVQPPPPTIRLFSTRTSCLKGSRSNVKPSPDDDDKNDNNGNYYYNKPDNSFGHDFTNQTVDIYKFIGLSSSS